MSVVIMTNNPIIHDRYAGRCEVDYLEESYRAVLIRCRNAIHAGALLLTHPLSGSVKPNETPYKSVVIRRRAGAAVDIDSLRLIEESIAACDRFGENRFALTEQLREDFMVIDDSLISGAFPGWESKK